MSKSIATTAVKTDYSPIAESLGTVAKEVTAKSNAWEDAVLKAAPVVHLAISTGYAVPFKGLDNAAKAAHKDAGRINITDLAKLFETKRGNTPDLKTIARWAILGAAVNGGADKATVQALRGSTTAGKVLAGIGGMEKVGSTTVEAIESALAAPPESRKPQTPSGGTETEDSPLQMLITAAARLSVDVLDAFDKDQIRAYFAAIDTLTETGAAHLAA